jgi:L-ascorbate metabolism protein UlaG (beta-lactamase superfamily)
LAALGAGLVTPTILLPDDGKTRRSRWDMIFSNHVPESPSLRPQPLMWSDDTITAAWIGHATVLLNVFGTKIITDPVFSRRIGINLLGLTTVGPSRLVEPALRFEELPPLDLILLSHAHMDHLDIPTLSKFNPNIPLVMAKNTIDVIDHLGWKNAVEVDWGESVERGGVRIEGLRVKHFGWRYPWENDRSRGNWAGRSFNGYLISKDDHHVVFGGDTAYQPHFKSLGERNIVVDLAIMPIGAYDPWIQNHCTPEEAMEMANHMNAKQILPIHWGTFIQSDEPTNEPIERFKKAMGEDSRHMALASIGETWSLNGEHATSSE